MGLVASTYGDKWIGKNGFNGSTSTTVHLYSNNHTPTKGDNDTTGFTECSGSGYASKVLTAGSWVATDAGTNGQLAYAAQTWTFSGALTTYGYYITDNAASSQVIFAELFSGGPFVFAAGGSLTLTPTVLLN